MNIDQAFPSKYFKAADFAEQPRILRMGHVQNEDIGDDRKPVLYFTAAKNWPEFNPKKGLVLNVTNKNMIKAAYGPYTEKWEGKPIELFHAMVELKGDTVEAIRVRVPRIAKPAPTPAQVDDMVGFDNHAPVPKKSIPIPGYQQPLAEEPPFDDRVDDIAETF